MAGDLKQISHSTQSLIQIRSWHYDTRTKNEAKPEINLPVGTHVMFTTPLNKKWYPAVIEEYLGYRSYKIRASDNAQYVRTWYHLKPYVPNSVKTAPKVENNKTSDSANVRVSTRIKKARVKLDL